MSTEQKLEAGDLFFYTGPGFTYTYLVLKTYEMGNILKENYFDAFIWLNRSGQNDRKYTALREKDFFPGNEINRLHKISSHIKIK